MNFAANTIGELPLVRRQTRLSSCHMDSFKEIIVLELGLSEGGFQHVAEKIKVSSVFGCDVPSVVGPSSSSRDAGAPLLWH
jgi:hypothetical protein